MTENISARSNYSVDDVAQPKRVGISAGASTPVFKIPWTVRVIAEIDKAAADNGVVLGAVGAADGKAYLQDDGGVFADDTTDANDAGTADVDIVAATPAAEDAVYWASDDPFCGLEHIISTAGTASDITAVWEYYNGTAWVEFSDVLDGAASSGDPWQAAAGTVYTTWTVPSDWTKTTVNSMGPYFWARWRITVMTTDYTTEPVMSRSRPLPIVTSTSGNQGLRAPATGVIDAIDVMVNDTSGTGDTEVQLLNLTRGTAMRFDITAQLTADTGVENVTPDTEFYVETGDLIVVQNVGTQPASNTFNDVIFIFHIT